MALHGQRCLGILFRRPGLHRPGWCSVCASPSARAYIFPPSTPSGHHATHNRHQRTLPYCLLVHPPPPHHLPLFAHFINSFLVPNTSCTAPPSPKIRVFGNEAAPRAVAGCLVTPPGYPTVPGSITDVHGADVPLVKSRRRLRCLRLPAQRPGILQWPPVRSRHWWLRQGRPGKAANVMATGVGAGRTTPLGAAERPRARQG